MKPTDEERREVARRLRENAEEHPNMQLILNVAFSCESLRPEGAMDWNVMSHDAAMRLADLIEPAPERTCRNDSTKRGKGVFLCSECGIDLDIAEMGEEDLDAFYEPNFCPNCGALVEGADR